MGEKTRKIGKEIEEYVVGTLLVCIRSYAIIMSLTFVQGDMALGLHPVATLASMFAGVQLLGGIGLFGFPIGLSLLKHLNDKGIIHILKK